jgi:putative membrane protein
MKHTVRLTVSALAMGGVLGACSTNDKPYAHESARYVTAAERLGAPPGEPIVVPNGSTPGVVAAAPLPATSMAAPVVVPQTVAMVAPSDARFVQDMTVGSVVEIELGRIAYVRAQSPEVRTFARQMLIDHRDMVVKLDNFALERGHLVQWTVPSDRAATIQRLRSLDDASFDRAYMDEMVQAHQKVVQKLQVQAGSGRETAAVATEALPTVQHHLEMAQQIRATL